MVILVKIRKLIFMCIRPLIDLVICIEFHVKHVFSTLWLVMMHLFDIFLLYVSGLSLLMHFGHHFSKDN